ncbi:MAG: 3-oxoacyl-ACP reductase FabG [Gammaproteobacteria bacterium]
MHLSDKIALVTGASRGIGLGIALELAKQGATVIGTSTSEGGADKITEALRENNLKGSGMVLDVTQTTSIQDLIATINSDFGVPSILINNAGITRDNLMLRMKDEEWDDIINTNLSAVFHVTKACLKGMLKLRWGRIVNISSVVAFSGNPGQVNYSAAKSGLIGFTKSLAQEIASRDITVNAIAPGYIDTDMTRDMTEEQRKALMSMIPMGRVGHVSDIANAVSFLVSDAASYITGETLHINGGMYMA